MTPLRRVLGPLVVLVAVGAVVGGVAVADRSSGPSGEADGEAGLRRPVVERSFFALEFDAVYSDLPAYRGVGWADELQREQEQAPYDGDFAGRFVTVEGGFRVTPRAEGCTGCPVVRLWFFGGSAAWGQGQRDRGTIAAGMVRGAAESGIDLRISNWARRGQTFQGDVDLLRSLLPGGPPPDVVVFYNGWNDVLAAVSHAFVHGVARDAQPALTMENVTAINDDVDGFLRAEVGAPAGRAVATQYRRLQDEARRLVDSVGAEAVFAFQSDAFVSDRQLAEYDRISGMTPEELRSSPFARALRAVVEDLGDGVVDLRGLFADHPRPVFLGLIHQNEEGAQVVADALLDELQPILDAAAPARPRGAG